MKDENMSVVERFIEHFGSVSAAARAIKRDRQVVQQWRKKSIPWAWAVEIERVTGGAIKSSEVHDEAAKVRHHG